MTVRSVKFAIKYSLRMNFFREQIEWRRLVAHCDCWICSVTTVVTSLIDFTRNGKSSKETETEKWCHPAERGL